MEKVLLKIDHLKQYFPLKKQLGKEQLFVRANDDISLEIFEGETLGLVGESGCGKSTLGRTLLQLYTQTEGQTLYSGRNLYDIVPKYLEKTIKNLEGERQKALDAQAKYADVLRDYEQSSDEQKTQKHKELAECKKDSHMKVHRIAQIIGGFYTEKNITPLGNLLAEKCKIAKKRHGINEKTEKIHAEKNVINAKRTSAINKIEKKLAMLEAEKESCTKAIQKIDKDICELKNGIAKTDEFEKYEAMLTDSIDLARLEYKEVRYLRSDIQLIFQDPYSSLNPRMTVGQIIGEGLIAHHMFKADDPAMQDYIMKVMDNCGLAPYMFHRYPHQFSGGQRQRIGIARSLALKPKFVVCDEAVSALDVSIQSQVINLLQDLKVKDTLTYLFISHDLSVVKYISDRIGVMYLGNMVELCSAQRIFENPLHPYTEALLMAIPTTDAHGRGQIVPLEGDIPSPIKPPSGCKFHTRCKYCTDVCKTIVPQWREVEPEHFLACHHPIK